MMADALDQPCPVCDARVAEWCIGGSSYMHIHLDRAYGVGTALAGSAR